MELFQVVFNTPATQPKLTFFDGKTGIVPTVAGLTVKV